MFRRTLSLAVLLLTLSGLALARTERIRITRLGRPWRVDLAGNSYFLAREQPVARGTLLLFRSYPDGRWTSVPRELVVSVRPSRGLAADADLARIRSARMPDPLQPGELRDLGETAGVAPATSMTSGMGSYSPSAVGSAGTSAVDPGRLAIDALVFRGDTPVPGAGAGGASAQAGYGAGGMVLNPTLVNPAAASAAATAATAAANGFPAAGTGGQPINPNGFPATTTTGAESGTQPINPNGFPATTTTGAESGIQPIGPNGFPTMTEPPNAGTGRSSTRPRSPSPR